MLRMRSQLPRRETTIATLAFFHKRRVPGLATRCVTMKGDAKQLSIQLHVLHKVEQGSVIRRDRHSGLQKNGVYGEGNPAITRWTISYGILEQLNLYGHR